MLTFLLWCILLIFCWPLALVVLSFTQLCGWCCYRSAFWDLPWKVYLSCRRRSSCYRLGCSAGQASRGEISLGQEMKEP